MNDPILLDIEPAAEVLSIGRTTMYKLISEGKVRTVNIGRRRLGERGETITSFPTCERTGRARECLSSRLTSRHCRGPLDD